MTIFEKIYFTLLIINCLLMFVGFILEDRYYIGENLENLFIGQIGLTIIYEFVRAILFMWGVSVDLFPSIL